MDEQYPCNFNLIVPFILCSTLFNKDLRTNVFLAHGSNNPHAPTIIPFTPFSNIVAVGNTDLYFTSVG